MLLFTLASATLYARFFCAFENSVFDGTVVGFF